MALGEDIATKTQRALNQLTKWRMVFASWQLGTRTKEDGECNAVRDHRELTMLLRVELNAVTGLLIEKGVFSALGYTAALGKEAEILMKSFEQMFPGFKAQDDGIAMDVPVANETIKRMRFPP